MNYVAALTDFFKSPKWMMNLLLAGLLCLIPILGWMVVLGWLVIGFWGREDDKMETFPDFDLKNFSTYLEKGLWPFLVILAVSIGGGIVIGILVGVFGGVGHAVLGHKGALSGMLDLFLALVNLALRIALMFITVPVALRAMILQDFVKAFDLPFVKKFVSLMWLESLITSIVCGVAACILIPIGLIALCVGVGLSFALLQFMSTHLYKQLYALYLSRGGEAIPLSPKLSGSDTPPPPPVAPAAV
jgi:hypothetical protein